MPDTALGDLQAWMQSAITGTMPADAGRVVDGSHGLPADDRLEIYRRSHTLRLLDAMRSGHPALRHLLGDDLFDEFALDYLRAWPSRSYTLLRLGEGFADHLTATRDEDASGAWADLIVDVARVERAFLEVYEGPGCEGEAPPAAPGPAATVQAAPCLRLLALSAGAGAYVRAVRAGELPAPPAPGPVHLALCRRDYVVTFTGLDRPQHDLLAGLLAGARLDAAAAAAGIAGPAALDLARGWTARGFFSATKEAA